MPKLNDTQSVLLSTAAQRENGSIYPLPETLSGARAKQAIERLIKHRLAEERECAEPTNIHRTDNDFSFGVFVTPAGLAAIGIELGAGGDTAKPAIEVEPRQTKSDLVLALLRRADGAVLAEITSATGWLPHSARAALTGLRKKGHAIERTKRGSDTYYYIASAK